MKDQVTIVAEWLMRASRGLVVLGTLLGIGALIWPMQTPGAIFFGIALWSLAAILKVVSLYVLGVPILDLYGVLQGHQDPSFRKHSNPISYRLYHLMPLAIFTVMFAFLLKSSLDAFQGKLP